jgi:hypothetical protein
MQLVDDLPVLRASVPGCEILLGRTASTYFNRLAGAGFSSHEVIELQLDERLPLEELEYQFVRPLEQLLTLASGFDSKTFDLRVGIEDDGDGLPWEATAHSVQHRSFDHDQNERLVVRPHMRFGMNSNGYPPDIDFGDLVPRWFELQAALSDVCDLIFSLRSDTPATCNNSCSRSPQRSRLCIVDSIHSWRRRPTKIEPATPRPLRPCRRSIQSIASGWRTSSRMRTSRVTPSGFRSCWRRPVR